MTRVRKPLAGLAIGIAAVALTAFVFAIGAIQPWWAEYDADLVAELPASSSATERIEGRLLELALDRLKCGTYYLSFPEKCLVDGEYVPRYEVPSVTPATDQ